MLGGRALPKFFVHCLQTVRIRWIWRWGGRGRSLSKLFATLALKKVVQVAQIRLRGGGGKFGQNPKEQLLFSENLPWEWNKNLNESAHFIASIFLSSKVVKNYIRPPNLDKIDYISYFWLILRNPRVLQLFMIVHLIIWEPRTWNVTEILWSPPQFMKQLYLNPNFRKQLQL